MHGTTVICVRHRGRAAMGGDGQVTLGDIVIKSTAKKIRGNGRRRRSCRFCRCDGRRFHPIGAVLSNAGRHKTASCCAPPKTSPATGAPTACCGGWEGHADTRRPPTHPHPNRQRRCPDAGRIRWRPSAAAAAYAQAAALAMINHGSAEMTAADIVRESLKIAADTCIYTNHHIALKEIDADL